MADYRLKQLNTRRAAWDFGGDPTALTHIEVEGDSGGGAGTATIEVPLPLPQAWGAVALTLLMLIDIEITPVGDSGNNTDWSVDTAGFSQDTNGFLTFTIRNHTTVAQPGDSGEFYVAVNRKD